MAEIKITKTFSEGFEMAKNSYTHLIFPTIAMFLYAVFYFIYEFTLGRKDISLWTASDYITIITLGIAGSILQLWIMIVSLNIVRNNENTKITIGKMLWSILYNYIYAFSYVLITMMILLLAIVLMSSLGIFGMLLIPLITITGYVIIVFLAIKFFFVPELIADTGKNPFVLFGKSWNMTKGLFWKILGLSFSLAFFNLAGLLMLGLGLLITLPVSFVVLMHFYNQVLKAKSSPTNLKTNTKTSSS